MNWLYRVSFYHVLRVTLCEVGILWLFMSNRRMWNVQPETWLWVFEVCEHQISSGCQRLVFLFLGRHWEPQLGPQGPTRILVNTWNVHRNSGPTLLLVWAWAPVPGIWELGTPGQRRICVICDTGMFCTSWGRRPVNRDPLHEAFSLAREGNYSLVSASFVQACC